MKKLLLLGMCLFLKCYTVLAQTDSNDEKKLTITGFADVYYQYAFKKTAPATSFTEQPNSFTLGMASVKMEKTVKNVGVVADLGWGPRAENANGSVGTSLASIKQLYLTYAPSSKLKFTFGNFFTFVGYEVVDAPSNANYSMSYGFSKGPFFHTGLKADYSINENWSALVGVFDETDKKFDIDGPRNVGAQLAYNKGKFKGFFNYLAGKVSEDSTGLKNQQVDFTATFQATEKFLLGVNASQKFYLRENQNSTNWTTLAAYQSFAINDKFTLALREEAFLDKNGEALGLTDNSIFSSTISGIYKISDLKLISELRLDNSNKKSFQDNKKNSLTSQLPMFLFAAVYVF